MNRSLRPIRTVSLLLLCVVALYPSSSRASEGSLCTPPSSALLLGGGCPHPPNPGPPPSALLLGGGQSPGAPTPSSALLLEGAHPHPPLSAKFTLSAVERALLGIFPSPRISKSIKLRQSNYLFPKSGGTIINCTFNTQQQGGQAMDAVFQKSAKTFRLEG